ncbi:hypothetical protein RclHR1_00050006 [Rhizophagus clarus]|uniref:HMG box domain-containing protein n=1 Tax=Rhizophagus clarus TaxID=94130 RepID=A0A2Z6RJR0_9GLOM|nr:hypothetical protein RclHR1_00050006 [Rhizophagus clarus]
MTQELNIKLTQAASNFEREYKIIYKNIININKLKFENFCPKKNKGRRCVRPPNSFFSFKKVVIQELGERCNNISQPDLSRLIAQKWRELPNDVKKSYGNFSRGVCEYYTYKNDPPTYKLIKF